MLDYEYHYPLTPIPSESHNIHPAFRNDPEVAEILNVNKSVTTLVPPPRNPLRGAIKPLFHATSEEVNSSTDSLADFEKFTDDSGSFTESQSGQSLIEPSLPLSARTQSKARPISTVTASTLSSLPCPTPLLPQEWASFLQDLQNAASLSKSQKTLVIALALAVPLPFPAIKGLIGWRLWRYQMVKNVRLGLENSSAFEKKRGRESVESVVQRWNQRWKERHVRVSLEVASKCKKAGGENVNFKVIVTKLRAPRIMDEADRSKSEAA